MPVRVQVDVIVTPTPQFVANAFFQTAERTSHMEEPMRDIAQRISDEFAANFAAEGRPTAWEPLAASTVAKRGSAHPILQDTGALAGAASSIDSWDIAGSGQLVVATESGTPAYGRFHPTGTRFMPVRDWTYLSPDVDEFIDQTMGDWVMEGFEAAWP